MNNQREAGFTLMETLVTLFIASLLIFMPLLSIENLTESIQIDLFFRELTSNVTLMQNHAILAGEKMIVEFIPQDNLIRFKNDTVSSGKSHPLYREMSLAESPCEIVGNSYGQIIFYENTGTISSRGAWNTYFDTSKGRYRLIFWLGSGRFEIQKIET